MHSKPGLCGWQVSAYRLLKFIKVYFQANRMSLKTCFPFHNLPSHPKQIWWMEFLLFTWQTPGEILLVYCGLFMTGFSELVDRFLLAYPTKYTPQGFRAKGCGNPSVGTPGQHYLLNLDGPAYWRATACLGRGHLLCKVVTYVNASTFDISMVY